MVTIRRAEEPDRTALQDMVADAGVFTTDEINCVDELLGIFLQQPKGDPYTFIVCCAEDNRPMGFACYGPHPLTEGTYDLYWLCVARSVQGNGVATALLDQVEKDLSTRDGRLLVAETSSTPPYATARTFYEHHGFRRWT